MRVLLFILLLLFSLFADEIRPAYLEIQETRTNEYTLLFKTPKGSEKGSIELSLDLPKSFKVHAKSLSSIDSYDLMKLEFSVLKSINKEVIKINNLESSSIELISKLVFLDGSGGIQRILPQTAKLIINHESGFSQLIYTYVDLGIHHILMGHDHLLFVLCLVLLIQNKKRLFFTITAFTLAHSITLILASLDIIFVSSVLVEALIALSIVFMAAEIVYDSRGKIYLAQKYPWLIASFFGLIHGLGFASVLKEIGLAPNDILPSLLFFNLGVEIGQLLFITLLLLLFFFIEKFLLVSLNMYRLLLAYIIGSIAVFWFLQRVLVV